jgi:nuclear pore complex protein Nup133
MASPNTLVLLVSYASAGAGEDSGAMVVDQFSFGPRRVYVILRLVAHGDAWGVNGVTVVPYVAVSVSCVVIFRSRLILFPCFGGLC